MKLISMTDYVLCNSNYNKVKNYAHFLQQPLKLEMFVPCDDEGNVMIESFSKKYQEAKQKVLFKNIELNHIDIENLKMYEREKISIEDTLNTSPDVEFELTENAIKQL